MVEIITYMKKLYFHSDIQQKFITEPEVKITFCASFGVLLNFKYRISTIRCHF